MIGQTFGRLMVAGLHHRDDRHRKHFRCECVCGNETIVQASLLKSGNTKSCGCLLRDGESRRHHGQAGAITAIILQYKRHARDRGIEFHLTRDEVDYLVRQPCHYCGIAAGNLKKTKNLREGFPHNGIDRVDNAHHYTSSNSVPCCGLCNRAKREMSRTQFIEWATRIAKHQAAMADQWGGLADATEAA